METPIKVTYMKRTLSYSLSLLLAVLIGTSVSHSQTPTTD